MKTVSLFDAQKRLSQLVDRIASGDEKEIVISLKGKPVARLVPIATEATCRIGIAKGAFVVPDDIDASNVEVAGLLLGTRGS